MEVRVPPHEAAEYPWSQKVLLVEEDANRGRAICARLAEDRRGRFAVGVVPRLDQAVEALRVRAYDLLLIGIALPGPGGQEVLQRARMLANRLPIVVMTAHPDEELALRTVEAGVQEHLILGGEIPRDLGRILRHAVVRHCGLTRLRRSYQAASPRAGFDPETGLSGRASFLRKLQETLSFAQRFREKPALLLVEVAELQALRNRFGPVLGARFLTELGRRITWCVRRTDTLGRTGEGELGVLLPHAATPLAVRMVGERIRAALSAPYEGLSVRPAVSIGTAWYPHDGESPESLIHAATVALGEARDLGGNHCRPFRGHDLPPWPDDLGQLLLPPGVSESSPR